MTTAQAQPAGRGPGWYRGDCHVHSVHSTGGEVTPEQLVAAAREAGLDFFATTEHNTAESHGTWKPYTSDDFLVILGQEVTTQTGHWLALGIDEGQVIEWRYGVGDGAIQRCLAQVHSAAGLCVVAHPHAPFPTGSFEYPLDGFDLVEVWNGRWSSELAWNADNEAALADWGRSLTAALPRAGWRPAIGNSDTHLQGQIGTPHTVVWAQELSTTAVLASLLAGRSWIAGSTAVELSVTASSGDRSAGIGERLETRGEPVVVRVEVLGVPGGEISFHTDKGLVVRELLPHDGGVECATTSSDSAFVRVEVRHADGQMAALTNPVLLT